MNFKQLLLLALLSITSHPIIGMGIQDAFPEEAVNMTAEQEQEIQKAITFIEEQIISIILNYMVQNQLQYAVFAGTVYEIQDEDVYVYLLDELDDQKAQWIIQFDITDYVLDQLSNEIPDVIA